jgi:TonB-linked SusC/RagA family outer membrane protein
MRLTVILLTAAFMSAHATGVSQKVTLSAKQISLKQVFTAIEAQTGYVVLVNKDVFIDATEKSISVSDMPLEEVLDLLLKDLPLKYLIKDKTIVLSRKITAALVDGLANSPLPVKVLTVRVTDSTGKPLPGASVSLKNKTLSGVTDKEGVIKLAVSENDVLVISFIGHTPKMLTVTASVLADPVLVVALQSVLNSLDDVAITINTGYQQIRPEQSTGSIYTITAKEYNSRINTTDFLAGLQNKIPGLLINNDIKFEGNGLFQIRGISTIKGNKNPLIVIDGYPTDLSLDMIDPNEIESVTVLRDAAAATIYGARSSNGVIIIERRKAKAGRIKVNFRGTVGFRPKENYDRYRWDEDESKIVVDYEKIKNSNASPVLWARQKTLGGFSNYSPANLVMNHWRSDTDPITAEERDRQLAAIAAYDNAADYSRLFLRTSAVQTYNVDMSGGSDRLLYYMTANYSHTDAMQVKNNNGIIRFSGRATLKMSERFSLELNNDYQEGRSTNVPVPDINNILPYERFEDANGNPGTLYSLSKITPIHNEFIMSAGLLDNMYYPLREMNEVSDKARNVNNRITANFRYKMGKGFQLSFGGVHESARSDNRHLATENSAEARQLINYYTKPNSAGGFIYNIPKGGILKQQFSSTQGFTLRAQANYDKQVARDHSLNLILGAEMRKLVTSSNTAAYFGYNDQTLFHQQIDFRTLSGSYSPSYTNGNGAFSYNNLFNQGYKDDRFISGYSNLVYAYKGKYSFTGSIRIDQSNLFGTDPQYKYKPLWSVGAAWNIHKEDFMQNVDWVRTLKLRAAHGFNGNVAKDALPQVIASDGLNTLNPASYFSNLTLLSYANSGLRWEQTRNFNLGLNYEIFHGISGSIDYYIKRSTDVLATNQIDASKGGTSALINQASISNKGLELSLQADWITRKAFNWNTGLVFARNTSKVLKVYNPDITASSQSYTYVTGSYSNYLEGYAVGALFSYRYAGLDNTGYPLIYDKDGVVKRLYTNDGRKAELDYEGSSIPVFNLGLSNRVDIGKCYLYCMINYFGNFRVRVPVPNASALRPLQGAGKYWKQAGDEKDPDIVPSVTTNAGLGYYVPVATTDKYTVNGAYFTVGDLTAAYSFRGSRFLVKTGISNLEVKVQASNIYTVALNKYNYSMATGSYAKPYITPTYTAALSVNF